MEPTPSPTTAPPTNLGPVTYYPGDVTVPCEGLRLSTGLACRRLTTGGLKVDYTDGSGGKSDANFHSKADGATVLTKTDGTTGWYYCSNSEDGFGGGGVGCIEFEANGEVIGYEMVLTGTSRNCGGGRTYWNTWVTCEENGGFGRVHEVDPNTGFTQVTKAADEGGNYESFAYDDQDPDVTARFFTTEDASNGALIRYTPTASAFGTGNSSHILTTDGGTYEYLVLNEDGSFTWSDVRSEGENSASEWFPQAEGIDVLSRELFFVSKAEKKLFVLDLATLTWTNTTTISGAFNLQPDQLARVMNDDEVLYFCEDGGSACDIHGRMSTGEFFTIVEGTDFSTETTGLTFSPDNKHMYFAMQGPSAIFDVWRTDGYPFNGAVVDTKYH